MDESLSSKLRVLVIDDEPGLRDMLQLGLSQHGYDVTTAVNGAEGLEQARQVAFDLVLCDIMMAGLNGVDVLKQLKKIRPDAEVVMATGHATLETAIESMKSGAYDYITKPYSVRHLCTIFDRAVEHRRLKRRVVDLEELDRLKTEFLANTSHEIRTPLNSLLGFQSLLLGGVYGGLTDKQKEMLGRAQVNAKRLLTLVTNLLDLSKVSARAMEAMIKPADAAELVSDVIEQMEALAINEGLTLAYEGPRSLPWPTDAERFQQIVINLVANAIKFTPRGGVTVRLDQPDAGHIRISVKDTGIGIKSDDIPLLFEPFRQIDGSTTRRYGGTGLGLSICKQMTELLGGQINVSSQPGSGSDFSVLLPRRALTPVELGLDPPVEEPKAGTLTRTNGSARKVLIVDDDCDTRRFLRDTLERAGCKVAEAEDGSDALGRARTGHPDLILLDISMPGMDGYEVARKLRADPAHQSVRIVTYSALTAGGEAEKARAAGCDDHLTKPCEPAELLHRLNDWLKSA